MDALLKDLADASLEVTAAEEAVAAAAFHNARDRLDAADAALTRLREKWPDMSRAERGIVGPSAKAVKARVDAAKTRVPRLSALTAVAPVADPEQDRAPDADDSAGVAGLTDGPPVATSVPERGWAQSGEPERAA